MGLGGNGIWRKSKQLFGKKYDNEKFWLKFGEKYYDTYKNKKWWVEKQETELIKYLKTISFDSVLEVGCGFGRVTKVINENFNVKRYEAFDISPHQIENARKYCHGMDVIFTASSINDYENSEKFDLVIAPEILMHISHDDIENVIKKTISYSTKYFIHTGIPSKPKTKDQSNHTFYHDFDGIFEKLNMNYHTVPVYDGNMIQIVERDNSTL